NRPTAQGATRSACQSIPGDLYNAAESSRRLRRLCASPRNRRKEFCSSRIGASDRATRKTKGGQPRKDQSALNRSKLRLVAIAGAWPRAPGERTRAFAGNPTTKSDGVTSQMAR